MTKHNEMTVEEAIEEIKTKPVVPPLADRWRGTWFVKGRHLRRDAKG